MITNLVKTRLFLLMTICTDFIFSNRNLHVSDLFNDKFLCTANFSHNSFDIFRGIGLAGFLQRMLKR